ncbi:hypothetical protein GPECTOR_4g595 [Gonium pectorale]|uniref:Uncharacterized protein n=1 Tax=Gonium pectorale TaxID=33097 RepID=A0A150GYW8_GONPE|nr:hypothetical protein GPECTOR_4g595 [Gonium pectorale]|eukprot:KXZ54530.1 hypothetical protein GPECTOR_4g595 [Gonium pectorale]
MQEQQPPQPPQQQRPQLRHRQRYDRRNCTPRGPPHPPPGPLPPVPIVPLLLLPGLLLVLLLPAPAAGYFLAAQRITGSAARYCGFSDLQRFKVWCVDANVSAWVTSNSTCQQYDLCIPLEGFEYLSCYNATYCSGLRAGLGRKNSQPLAACLVLTAAANGTMATCDVEILGPSIYDTPPPAPPPSPGTDSPPPSGGGGRKWALWKTMTIIWSILGFAALLVAVVFLIRWILRRRAQAITSSPVTVLSDVAKQQMEAQQQLQQGQGPGGGLLQPAGAAAPGQQMAAQLPGGAADMTVTIRPMAPDGKPILAYGASYPPPSPLESMLTSNGNPRHLPPNAGDALLRVAADSRAVYNSPPMRAPQVPLPPQQGVPAPLLAAAGLAGPPPAGAAAAGMAPYGMTPSDGAATAGAYPSGQYPAISGAGSPAGAAPAPPPGGAAWGAGPGGLGANIPASVTPAALVPPPAATLQNPSASLEASLSPR